MRKNSFYAQKVSRGKYFQESERKKERKNIYKRVRGKNRIQHSTFFFVFVIDIVKLFTLQLFYLNISIDRLYYKKKIFFPTTINYLQLRGMLTV